MDIRNEIRKILKEELASLVNPLDATADAVSLQARGVTDRVIALKDRIGKTKKEMSTDLNAKKKATMVPQSNEPDIERQRRQYDDMKIKDIEEKLKNAEEEGEELDALQKDMSTMSGYLKKIQIQKDELQAAITKLSGQRA